MPKRDQWKIDVRIRASSRGQNGSDAGPEPFELRVFLQGLRQKQHRWGSAWGIRKRLEQKFCIERVLTRHRRALRAIVCKMRLSLPKGKVAVDYSLHASLTFSWGWHGSSPICSSCLPHRNCSYSFQMLSAHPGESILFVEACQCSFSSLCTR